GPQSIDGVSLAATLKDPAARVRDHAYHAYPKAKLGRAIRTARYRLVEWRNPGEPIATAQYELYDYQSDPHETRNHAADNPQIVKRLAATLAAYPEPTPRSRKRRNQKAGVEAVSPAITNQPLSIVAEVNAKKTGAPGCCPGPGRKSARQKKGP
ncbi:MAG: sulfatase/phosphatase domain-containing protein, partial [Pirellulaceae bacterium]